MQPALPFVGIRPSSPPINILAGFVDDRSDIVLLLGCRKARALIEHPLLLCPILLGFGSLSLLGLGDRRDEFRTTTSLVDLVPRLTMGIQFSVLGRVFAGRIEDRTFKELVIPYSMSPGFPVRVVHPTRLVSGAQVTDLCHNRAAAHGCVVPHGMRTCTIWPWPV